MPAGRPSKINAETLTILEDAFMSNCNFTEACFKAGICTRTLDRYIEKNPEYSQKIDALRSNHKIKAKYLLTKALDNNDVDTAKWVLNHTDKQYKTTLKQEVSLEGGTFKAFLEAISENKAADE